MKDDAVAPVIAVLLILAAIATFVAVWNATVLPSMKEQSEMVHLQSVETSFARFSSDIDYAIASGKNNIPIHVSEPVQLGGGDVIFNNVRSGGSLKIRNGTQALYNITYGTEGTEMIANATVGTISYEPSGNFWQDQGYRWQYGYINVTKHPSGKNSLQTPLDYSRESLNDILNETLSPFGDVTLDRNGNCTIWVVDLSADDRHPSVSGNGMGTLKLTSTISSSGSYPYSTFFINVPSENSPLGNATLKKWNSTLPAYFSVAKLSDTTLQLTQKSGSPCVTVNITKVSLSVGAY